MSTPVTPTISCGVAILAAGSSSRMGRSKLLLPWEGTSVIAHLIGSWKRLAPAQIAVVCGAEDREIATELDRLEFPREARIQNVDPSRGMFSSVQCASQWPGWDPTLTHCAIALGDQPLVRLATLRAVASLVAQNPTKICQPSMEGRPRHPVFLPMHFLRELASSGEESLRGFLQSRSAEVQLLEIDDHGLNLDLDAPADYERALQLAQRESLR